MFVDGYELKKFKKIEFVDLRANVIQNTDVTFTNYYYRPLVERIVLDKCVYIEERHQIWNSFLN